MAVFIEGYRGSGKSKYAVSKIQEAIRAGRQVATNLDLHLDKLVPELPKATYTRIPDFPRSSDLFGLGKAYPELDPDDNKTYNEKKFGIVCIDEMLTSFNSRNWNDPDRPEVINWSVQSRKFGWNPLYLGQDIDAVDKQIRETIISELWSCRSSLNLFPGMFYKFFIKPWFTRLVPKFHLCNMYDGKKKDKSHFNGTEYFRRNDLHSAYNTAQNFRKDVTLKENGTKKPIEFDNRATYTVLSPNYFKQLDVKKSEPAKSISNDSAPVPERKPLPKLQIILLCLVGLGWYFTNQTEKTTTEHQNEKDKNSLQGSASVSQSQTSKTIEAAQTRYFITCSVQSNNYIDYCFERDGQPYHPNDEGAAIQQIKPCLAFLHFYDDTKIRVTCNPVRIQSQPLEQFEQTENLLASN